MKLGKKILKYLFAFLIPVVIIILSVVFKSIINGDYFLNGENFLVADMNQQYISLLSYVWDCLHGIESVLYSFSKGIGGNMLPTIAYYLSSPLNFIYYFFNRIDIPLATCIITLIKIGLASLFALFFFDYKFKNKKSNLIFCITYSLIAFSINYYFNIMWLDNLALLPLVLLGIEKILDKKSFAFYCLFLAISIISNFYTGYMVCIFSVIYFFYEIIISEKENKWKEYKGALIKFIFGSLLAAAISSFILFPTIYGLQSITRKTLESSWFNFSFSSDLFKNIFGRFLIGSNNINSISALQTPCLYCGMLTLILVFFYFMNENIKTKEKITTGCVLLLFFFSLIIPILNFIWHGLSFTNAYTSRFSFIISFFLIYIGAKNYYKFDKMKILPTIVFGIVISLIYIYFGAINLSFLNKEGAIYSVIFTCVYLILLYICVNKKDNNVKKIMKYLLLGIALIELFINVNLTLITKREWDMFDRYKDYYNDVCLKTSDFGEEFYRTAGNENYGFADSFLCNNKGVGNLISTDYKYFNEFWKNNGETSSLLGEYYTLDNVPILDSILGIKYVYGNTYNSSHTFIKKYNNKKYSIARDKKFDRTFNLYKNNNALSIGFLASPKLETVYENYKTKTSFDSLNKMMASLSGNINPVLHEYPVERDLNIDDRIQQSEEEEIITTNSENYKFKIDNNEPYIYFNADYFVVSTFSDTDPNAYLYINDNLVGTFTYSDSASLKIPNNYEGKIIDITLKLPANSNIKIESLHAYSFDEEVFKEDINYLKERQLKNVKAEKNIISGDIVASEDSTLVITVPYEKGWNITVDGEKQNYEKILGGLIGINIKKGNHKMKMTFIPPYLKEGIIISFAATIILMLSVLLSLKKKGFNEKR